MNTWGNNIKLSIFGESHGKAIGVILDGLPPGMDVDFDMISREMKRRSPSDGVYSTARNEKDQVEIISGLYNEKTTGATLCGIIYNQNARERDYNSVLRPGHGDWTALLKYKGYADTRGGGHYSGRLTAPLVFAGALAKQILTSYKVEIYARIAAIGDITDDSNPESPDEWKAISSKTFAAGDMAEEMLALIARTKEKGDSVGGIIEATAFGVIGGLGAPFFGSVESSISSMMFSIPGIKGVEFGNGFGFSRMFGSEANDEIYSENGELKSRTNHNGGILGGITNGMPLKLRVSVKPTASIAQTQKSVDSNSMENCELEIRGRHDACIAPRAVPVVEAAIALCLLDFMNV
jgi:chorismate synthase